MKRCAFLGTFGDVSFATTGAISGLQHVGMNTGNMLFQYALRNLFKDPKSEVDVGVDPKFLRDHFDVLVIPAANQINPKWDLSGWAGLVEKSQLPAAIIGLGAQAQTQESTEIPLQSGTKRFLNVVSERATAIGVRGEFTKAVLEKHGIQNAIVTGCPSQSINMRVTGASIEARLKRIMSHGISKAAYAVGTLEDYARSTEKKLATLMSEVDHDLVFQTDNRFIFPIIGCEVQDTDAEFWGWARKFLQPSGTSETFSHYVRSRGRVFSSAAQWIDSMSKLDVAIGMRIHGAIAALQSGSLGVCVTFDSRTLELCQTMEVPHIPAEEIAQVDNLLEVFSRVRFSASEFDRKRKNNLDAIKRVLDEAGLSSTI